MPPFTHTVHEVTAKGVTSQPPRVAKDGHVELVAQAKNWVPTEDLHFGFNSSIKRTGAERCMGYIHISKSQDCINDLY